VAQTTILLGDALAGLQQINSGAVQCCVTSPPYYALRDYGCEGQLGLEDTPELYVERLVEVFREVRRTLNERGTLWLNVGDSYAGSGKGAQGSTGARADRTFTATGLKTTGGAKPKDLLGIPWIVALALRADGWYLRSSIIWHKTSPMPESVKDRPTRSHEYVFLLSKSADYDYDGVAIREPAVQKPQKRRVPHKARTIPGQPTSHLAACVVRDDAQQDSDGTRNMRDVITISPTPCKEAHFAVMPTTLADLCIRAGSRPGDLILDPFLGAATTALAANRLGRHACGCELNPSYADISVARLAKEGYQADIFE
jgi:DNA modification methylase